MVAAGDIAHCDSPADEQTASLIDQIDPALVLALGDLAYDEGTTAEFSDCYDPTWGRHRSITRPTPGNHEYLTPGAEPYFRYFGSAAGRQGEGYYSLDLGAWHLVVLNSNCDEIGGCDRTSPQGRWLAADLAANPQTCLLASMHHPRFSSGRYGADEDVRPLWEQLAAAGADLILSGHEHSYERFAPQTPDGVASSDGPRLFVVGTGGIWLREFTGVADNSERRVVDHGLLDLRLGDGHYSWQFLDVDGGVRDDGVDDCGEPPSPPPVSDVVGVDVPVRRGADDVEERGSGQVYGNSSDLELVVDGSAQKVGVRFTDVPVPRDAVIESAFLQFTTDEVSSGSASLVVRGQASDDAEGFSSSVGDVSGRATTESSVGWSPPVWSTVGESGSGQRSPDLSSVVSEIVGREGWRSGNALVFLIEGSGRRTAESFEGSSSKAPRLILTYRAESSPPVSDVVGVDVPVRRGADDVEERGSGQVYGNSSDLELVVDGSAQKVGVRFTDVPVPRDAVIESAFLQFTTDEVSSGSASLVVRGQASDDAEGFSSSVGDVSGRATTESSVGWSPPVWSTVGESGSGQRSPDLSSVVSEIVGREGWRSGNALVFLIEGSGRRTAESFEGSSSKAPRLILTYRAESSPPEPPPPKPPPPEPEEQTVTLTVTAGSDDAESAVSGSMYVTSSDLELAEDRNPQTVGIRFVDVPVPRHSTITSAVVQFTVDEVGDGPVSLLIRGEASDDGATFSTVAGDIADRVVTESSVGWSPPVWSTVGESGSGQRSPDLSSVVSEIVGREGWRSGNALVFLIEGSGRRTAESFEGSSSKAPRLILTYEVPTAG